MDPIYFIVVLLAALVFVSGLAIVYSFRQISKLLRLVRERSTELKEIHEQLKKAHEELKSLDKMKTDFMNIAAHELKTPLVPMVGYLSLINKENLSTEDKEGLEIALKNTKRLQRLVSDILDIAKLESKVMKFNMEDIQLLEVAKDAVASVEPFAKEKKIALDAKLPQELPLIRGDSGRLNQVMTNLINNAIKFTDQGGVTVEVRLENGKVVASVRDTGIGMRENEIPKLFTKFYQTDTSAKRKYGGTGLGLAICKEIVHAHSGEIWVESKLGQGSTFSFSLPVMTGACQEAAKLEEPGSTQELPK